MKGLKQLLQALHRILLKNYFCAGITIHMMR
jgi:hypothetical protein